MRGMVKLIEDLPFVRFRKDGSDHFLDRERIGLTICGREVDPWKATFLPRGPKKRPCVQCMAGRMRRSRQRLRQRVALTRQQRGMIR